MVFELQRNSSIGNLFLTELRDTTIQIDPMRFRFNLERLGMLLAYEISKELDYSNHSVRTPLGHWETELPKNEIVLITVMRAGLPFFTGFQNLFDGASSGFIGAQRREGEQINIELNYLASGDLNGKTVILADPMLATGKSIIKTINAMLKNGTPAFIHIAAVIASPEGIKEIESQINIPFKIWTCSIDLSLDENSYIVPGLGDAGDLCYGEKL